MDLDGKTVVIADLESNGLLPTISKIWQLSVKDYGSDTVESYNEYGGLPLQEGLDRLAAADFMVFHNGLQFDLAAISKVLGVDLDWTKVIDTMVLSRLGKPEKRSHSLAAYGERFGVSKPFHEDWTKWSLAMEYRCSEDVKITEMVFDLLRPMLTLQPRAVEIEHACHWQTGKIMRRGFRLDEPYVYEQVKRLLAQQEEILDDLQKVFKPVLVPVEANPAKRTKSLKVVNRAHPLRGQLEPGVEFSAVEVQEFNPGSTQQVATRLIRKYGWAPSSFTATGLPAITEETLSGLDYPEAKVFLEYLRNQKNLGFMQGEPRADGAGGGWLHHCRGGRVYAYINACKAVTGRPSCSSPNLQQVPADAWLRKSFVPTEGRDLVGVDASGLELRMLGHYLAPLDGGAYAREVVEGDVHTRMMKACRFLQSDNVKAARDGMKRGIYGLIYGAGNWKLGQIYAQTLLDQGLPAIPTSQYQKEGRRVRNAIEENIVGYKELTKKVKAKAKLAGKLTGLDGRTLWVRGLHSALNLLLQSGGIIVVKEAMRIAPEYLGDHGLCEDKHYWPVAWVHDEIQMEALPEVAEEVGRRYVETFTLAGENLGVRCRLDGEFKVGPDWSCTH